MPNRNNVQRTEDQAPLSKKERLSYCAGEVATCSMFAFFTSLLVYFYTDVIQISPGVVGLIVGLSQLFNGSSDLMAGMIIDRTKSRFGHARAWLLRIAGPYFLGILLLIAIPPVHPKAQAVYIFFTYNLMVTVIFTLTQIPYSSLITYMTRSQSERAGTNILRMTISPLANMAITLLFLPIVNRLGGGQRAWIVCTAVYGAICSLLLLWCFFFTRERVKIPAEQTEANIPLRTTLSAIFHNKYFIIVFFFLFSLAFYQTLAGTMLTYYCKVFLNTENLMGVINAGSQFMMVIVTPIVGHFSYLTSKRNWCYLGAFCIIVGALLILPFSRSLPIIFLSALIRGAGLACEYAMMYTMVADVVEYGHWKTGLRTPSAIQSAVTSGQKFGQGISSALIAGNMGFVGYNGSLAAAQQPASARAAIFFVFILGMIIVAAAVIFILSFYHLDKEYPTMIKDLLERESCSNTSFENPLT